MLLLAPFGRSAAMIWSAVTYMRNICSGWLTGEARFKTKQSKDIKFLLAKVLLMKATC